MIIVPEMIGANIGIYNGRAFNQVEIKVFSKNVYFSLKWWDIIWVNFQ